ncbi:hypothetical protein ACLKA6_018243 [Drosophila palustris]
MYRFIVGPKIEKQTVVLTPKELNFAFLKLLELVQRSEFKEDYDKLKKGQLVQTSIQSLTPFIQQSDEFGRQVSLIRVGGRLLNAPLEYDAKFPVLMPKSCHLVGLFIARRGVPSRIYSDNATNFVGTNNLLRELQEAFERQRTSLQSFAAEKRMEWCASFRRAVGSSRQVRQAPPAAADRKRFAGGKRGQRAPGGRRGNPQFAASNSTERRSQRWRSADTRAPAHRSAASFAAARIRAGHTKQRNFVLSQVAAAVHAQTAVLASVVEGLRSQPSTSRQVDSRAAQLGNRGTRGHPRGQHSTSALDNRQNRGGRSRGRRPHQGGRRKNSRGRV